MRETRLRPAGKCGGPPSVGALAASPGRWLPLPARKSLRRQLPRRSAGTEPPAGDGGRTDGGPGRRPCPAYLDFEEEPCMDEEENVPEVEEAAPPAPLAQPP